MERMQVQILAVEDDDGDFKMIERAFAKAKIANPIIRAYDGVEALQILRGASALGRLRRPFMVMTDIAMPRMDGLALVKAIRDDPELKKTVVFMLTTSNHDADKHAAYDLNVAGYILKENAGQGFLQLVQLLDGYSRIVEMPS
jgi:CheY-like chemotaxis protein